MNIIFTRAAQSAALAMGAPLGWLIIQYAQGADIATELSTNQGLYIYMLLATAFVFTLFGIYVGRQEEIMAKLAFRDGLTGLHNVRFFRERLDEEVGISKRHQQPLSLIYFDLDYFKLVNDQYGHPAGDTVLKKITETTRKMVRNHDVFARVGGEEFVLLLPRCNLVDAKGRAELIRHSIEKLQIILDSNKKLNVTISLGVATLTDQESAGGFYKRVDKNLYEAKNTGRNRLVG